MIDHFDLIASIYDRLIGAPDIERLRTLLDLPTPGWMLDGGGGTGRVASRLRPLVGHLVVNDLSHRMLQKACEKSMWPVRARVERLPFADAHFDRVLVVDALHHFGDQREAIRDLVRVLKPGGRLVIEEPDLNRKTVKLLAVGEKLALMRSRFHTPQAIRAMLTSHGLSARIESDGRFTAWIIAQK
ncbi:MAG: class I SAM-dependent methyltransferase [Desulfobacterales bacterium]|nr:MAG: class I SAM-dependent methyltransferase [Desulfobacterales bacterium]